MIVKGAEPLAAARTAVTRAELREHLIELWAQVFERELREELEAEAVESDRPTPPAVDAERSR
jgi:hypothetical protein